MLDYRKGIPAMTDLLALYSSVGWTNYTNNPTMLKEAVKASLWQLAVYDEKELVAYIRLVGDGTLSFWCKTSWCDQITSAKALARNS